LHAKLTKRKKIRKKKDLDSQQPRNSVITISFSHEQKCRAFPEIDAKKVRTMKERKDSRVTEIRSQKKRVTEIPGKQRNIRGGECFKLKAAAFGPKKKNSQTEISWKDLQHARKNKR
jgi:hypothetical protein